jgi:hypothetical protein
MNMSTAISFLGLLINLIGVVMIYRYSKKITGPSFPDLSDTFRWSYLTTIVDWGVRFVIIGTALQLIGVLIDLVKKYL